MRAWAWVAVAASAATVAMAACGGAGGTGGTTGTGGATSTTVVSASSTTGSGGSGGQGCGSFTYIDLPMCEACVTASCCAELAACNTGTPCAALFACIDGCMGDMSCEMQCETTDEGGLSEAQALVNCFNASCMSLPACDTGQVCDSGLAVMMDPACGDCLGKSCCTQYEACAEDTTCVDCITDKTTAGCSADAAYTAAAACETGSCFCECPETICDSGLATQNGSCNSCLGANCCTEIDACKDNAACDACLTSMSPPASCSSNTLLSTYEACLNENCATVCAASATCTGPIGVDGGMGGGGGGGGTGGADGG